MNLNESRRQTKETCIQTYVGSRSGSTKFGKKQPRYIVRERMDFIEKIEVYETRVAELLDDRALKCRDIDPLICLSNKRIDIPTPRFIQDYEKERTPLHIDELNSNAHDIIFDRLHRIRQIDLCFDMLNNRNDVSSGIFDSTWVRDREEKDNDIYLNPSSRLNAYKGWSPQVDSFSKLQWESLIFVAALSLQGTK